MKPWFIAGIVALIVGFWTTADAQRDHRPRMGWKNMMLEKLDLTDEQRVKVRQARMATEKAMVRLKADAKIARMELEEIMVEVDPNREDLKAKLAVINAARSKMLEKSVNLRLEMKKILTPEQQEKMRHMMMWGKGMHKKKGDMRMRWEMKMKNQCTMYL